MEVFTIISTVSLLLALLSAVTIVLNLGNYPQSMKVMNIVWPLTALWAGLLALWAFFSFQGKHSDSSADAKMDMKKDADMNMKMDMNMGKTPFWQKIALSTFHCGAGCTLADMIGESFGAGVLATVGLHGIGWLWTLDYILALLIGAFFQYAAIRPMSQKETSGRVFLKALKIDFLSLTSWQVGMYALSYLFFFVILPEPLSRTSSGFWFIMQLAMCAGFICAYPMNWFLVKKGIKPAM